MVVCRVKTHKYINESEIGSVIECNIFLRCGNQIIGTAYI